MIIRNFMKNDKRIKLITNKVNRKILFCKSIGTLNSKGKYISYFSFFEFNVFSN